MLISGSGKRKHDSTTTWSGTIPSGSYFISGNNHYYFANNTVVTSVGAVDYTGLTWNTTGTPGTQVYSNPGQQAKTKQYTKPRHWKFQNKYKYYPRPAQYSGYWNMYGNTFPTDNYYYESYVDQCSPEVQGWEDWADNYDDYWDDYWGQWDMNEFPPYYQGDYVDQGLPGSSVFTFGGNRNNSISMNGRKRHEMVSNMREMGRNMRDMGRDMREMGRNMREMGRNMRENFRKNSIPVNGRYVFANNGHNITVNGRAITQNGSCGVCTSYTSNGNVCTNASGNSYAAAAVYDDFTPTPQKRAKTDANSTPLVASSDDGKVHPAILHEEECAICYDPYTRIEEVGYLPCAHYFHKYCLDNWLAFDNTCPVCRVNAVTGASE